MGDACVTDQNPHRLTFAFGDLLHEFATIEVFKFDNPTDESWGSKGLGFLQEDSYICCCIVIDKFVNTERLVF